MFRWKLRMLFIIFLITLNKTYQDVVVSRDFIHDYNDIFNPPFNVIRKQVTYAKHVLPPFNYELIYTTIVTPTMDSVIMHITEYLFWLVTFRDVAALYNTLRQLPVINDIDAQPMTWNGHTLVTYALSLLPLQRKQRMLFVLAHFGANFKKSQLLTGKTVLMYSAEQNERGLTEYFSTFDTFSTSLLYGVTSNGETALHHAVKSNSIKTVMLLKQFPALINRQNKKGNTPLHEAVASNNYRFVKLLMNAGANPVVLNKFYEDPLSQTLKFQNQLIYNTLIESPLYTTGIVRHSKTLRHRLRRIHEAFKQHVPESVLQNILKPELQINGTTLCIFRDSQERNIISMAIDHQYYTVLGLLLDHFKSAYKRRLPMWENCNVHEPCRDNVYPLEKYIQTFDGRTQNATNLRKLMRAMVPVDGTSALMHAIRHKGAELVLSNFIPFGAKGVMLSDLKLNAYELGLEASGHNALTLASGIPKSRGKILTQSILNLMSIGLIGNISEHVQGFFQTLSTTSTLKDASLIDLVAKKAAPAVQLWYCTFTKIDPIDAMEVAFLTNSLPETFPGFSPHLPCSPILYHVKLALNHLKQRQVPGIDNIDALVRSPSIHWNSGRTIQQALYELGQTRVSLNA